MNTNLLTILNASLNTGYFPKPWKTAIMILIPKPGKSPHSHTNYRPISLLEVTGKHYERIINNRFTSHLKAKNFINNRQHSFTTKRGTQTAIATLHETIAKHKANNNKPLVGRDVSKAFDKIWHDGLIFKIYQTDPPAQLLKILTKLHR